MRRNTLSALALLPLVACFDVVIPEEPEPAPAELENGEWAFEMVEMGVSGDCATIAVVPEPYLAFGWVETHGEAGVSIDVEGLWFEGERDGDRLRAVAYDDYGIEPAPAPDEPGMEEGYEGSERSDAGEEEIDEACILPVGAKCEEVEDEPFATMEADILDPSHMVGSIVVDLGLYGEDCVVEIGFEAEAIDDDCDCDCEDGDDDVVIQGSGEASAASRG